MIDSVLSGKSRKRIWDDFEGNETGAEPLNGEKCEHLKYKCQDLVCFSSEGKGLELGHHVWEAATESMFGQFSWKSNEICVSAD